MKMTKKQVIESFKELILPFVIDLYEKDGITDKPARREAFNNYTDSLCKDGQITERLYNSICLPSYLED